MAESPNTARKRKGFRSLTSVQRFGVLAGGAFALYLLAGFFVVPSILRWQIREQVPSLALRNVEVGRVRVNPLALSLRIENLALTTTNGEPFASVGEFYANLQASSLFRFAFVLDEVRVGSLEAHVDRVGKLAFNFDDILARYATAPDPEREPSGLPKAFIRRIAVTNGAVYLTDSSATNVFQTRIESIDCLLTNFSTLSNHFSPHLITARTSDGTAVRVEGGVVLQPLAARGVVTVDGVKLPTYERYSSEFVNVLIGRGTVNLKTEYELALGAVTNATLTNLAVEIDDVHLKQATDGKELAEARRVSLSDVSASLGGRSIRVGSVLVDGARRVFERYPTTTLESTMVVKKETLRNLATLVERLNAELGWKLAAPEIVATNIYARLVDYTHTPPNVVEVTNIAVSVTGISNERGAPVRIVAGVEALPSGRVDVEVDATIIPVHATARVRLRAGVIAPANPYLQDFIPLEVLSGTVAADVEATVDLHDDTLPLVQGKLSSQVDDFAIRQVGSEETVLQWNRVGVEQAEFSVRPEEFRVKEILLDGVRAHIVRGPDERLKLMNLIASVSSNAPAQVPVPEIAPDAAERIAGLPPIRIETVRLKNVGLDATDEAMQPVARAGVKSVNGTVTGLTSDATVRAAVDLEGNIDERGPFSVKGVIQPIAQPWFADLTVTTRNVHLRPGSPYFGRYGGYPIEGGNVSTEFKWRLNDRDIQMENLITVDQIKLGSKTGSPDATSLPVKLGIALLTDTEGRIELDVPVNGNLDDPNFYIWNAVWRVVENLLVKAATAPFKMLGSMFGGGGGEDDLGYVDFAAGSASLDPDGERKLDKLAEALSKRPMLTLEVAPAFDPSTDRPVMRDARFEALLLKFRSGEAAAGLAQRAEGDERSRLLRMAFTNQFGPFPLVTNVVYQTNSVAAVDASKTVPVPPEEKPRKTYKGAGQIVKGAQAQFESVVESQEEASSAVPPGEETVRQPASDLVTSSTIVTPVIPPEPEMVARLMGTIEVSDAELAALGGERADRIREFLIAKPDVGPGRVTIPPADPEKSPDPGLRVTMQLN